jgi:hypothetical protein
VAEWKKKCKKARDDVLELDTTAKSRASTSSPTVFGKTNLPQPDLSAQIAQVNASTQGVQIAQLALVNAEEAYQAAVDKQEANAKVMSNIQAQLKKLQKTGKTLEEIKKILRDCIVVLVDLIRKINKLEDFFTVPHTVIDHLVMPRAREFAGDLTKAGSRALTKSWDPQHRRHLQAGDIYLNPATQGILLPATGHSRNVHACGP